MLEDCPASLVSLPSAQTISVQTEREALESALSETVEQIEGTYEGTFTLSQVTGEHQISLTFQQSGPEVAVTYRSVLGGRGSGKSTIAGNVITAVPLRSEPNCLGLFTASFKFFGDTVSFTYSGQDCNGPAQGRGIAKKLISRVTGQIPSDQGFDDSLKVIQRASQTSAAAALNNLKVRFSAGNDRLAQLVRKEQDLAAEAERLDKAIVEAVSKEPSKRQHFGATDQGPPG
jgi:hypothetical protein